MGIHLYHLNVNYKVTMMLFQLGKYLLLLQAGVFMLRCFYLLIVLILGFFILKAISNRRSKVGNISATPYQRVVTPESDLSRACPKCGNVTKAFNSFCPGCGTAL